MAASGEEGATLNDQEAERDMTSGEESRKRLIVFTKDPKTDVSQILSLLSETSSLQCGVMCYGSYLKEILESFVDKVIVLYHPYSAETPLPDLSDMKDFLDYYRSKHGPGNIKVVISDVKDINLERQIIARWMEGGYRDCELLTLSKEEMKYLTKHKINPLSVERRMANKLRHIHHILKEASEKNRKKNLRKGRHAIFSRSTNDDYCWITDLLRSDHFKDHVSDVKHFEITVDPVNTERCTFGIFYFTKRGQINETDSEDVQLILEHTGRLGKDHVIIVMDDVEDSSDQEKIRILERHPSTGEMYRNLFLFSHQEKQSNYQTLFLSLMEINKCLQQAAAEASFEEKIDKIKNIIKRSARNRYMWYLSGYYTVGIFSGSSESDYEWLINRLKWESFHIKIITVLPHYISNNGGRQFREAVSRCTFGILYHTKKRGRINIVDVTDSVYDEELRYLCERLGQDNVIIVMDDVEDSSDQEKIRILERHPSIGEMYSNLFLFSHQEKQSNYQTLVLPVKEINKHLPQAAAEDSFEEKIDKIRKIIFSTRSIFTGYLPGYHTVGIFSMSSESDYEWLINRLKSESFHNKITVLPHYISNNGWQQFREAVSRCTFGILYHTKKSGPINIVDVTDSVYDEELKYLSERLGKEKVIVVVDDLEDTSSKEKARILEAQPSIGMLAKDLFLFKEVEKQNRTNPIVK